MARPPSLGPTAKELEILGILWAAGREMTLGDIQKAIQKHRPVASSTVATILNVMRDKKLVKRSRRKNQYLWSASPKAEAATSKSQSLLDLSRTLFENSLGKLFRHVFESPALYSNLMGDPSLSEADRQLIEGLRRTVVEDSEARTEIRDQPESK